MKGIILAGGKGLRLFPSTKVLSKHLLTIYDKPMVYYPLSTLMLCKIRDILIITTANDQPLYRKLFGNGEKLGLNLSYAIQNQANGIAEAFIIAEEFIGDDDICLILGDNVFLGDSFNKVLCQAVNRTAEAVIFAYKSFTPQLFGVLEINKGKIIQIEEKPKYPKSNYIVPGLYIYKNSVINIAKHLKPSERGELEITEINNMYCNKNQLDAVFLPKDVVWFDVGSNKDMLCAANYIAEIQSDEDKYVGCIEEIAYRQGFISKEQLLNLVPKNNSNEYINHLLKLVGDVE